MSAIPGLDRREFLVGAGAAVVASTLPLTLAVAAVGDTTPRAQLADWHIDDMWGVCPRPSEAIGYGRPCGDSELIAAVHAVDQQFVA